MAITGTTAAWIAGAAIAASVASTVAQMYAQYQAAQQQAGVLKYQARIAANQAEATRQAAQAQAQQERTKLDRIRATARARAAASGVDPYEGSPLLVMLENARQSELETQMVRYRGELGAMTAADESRIRRFQSKAVRSGAAFGATTTLLTGVANAAGAASRIKFGTGSGDPMSAAYGLEG